MQMQTRGGKVANQLSDFINSAVNKDKEMFVRVVTDDHRTLQEDVFKLFQKCIEEWANNYVEGNYDDRNEYTCKASYEMMKVLNDKNLY